MSKTKKDSTVTMNVNFDAEKDMETMSNPGQWLMSYMHVSFQEIALKDFNRDVSFVDLDSIYAHMLDSIGFPAVVASCIVDSTGRVSYWAENRISARKPGNSASTRIRGHEGTLSSPSSFLARISSEGS